MLHKITKFFSKPAKPSVDVRYIDAGNHQIAKSKISRAALEVIETLQAEGWQAYLVGGGVRDLLLGLRPKDFDIATDAKPEQVNAIFKRSRIIGRRFKIVHVRFGREIIEVTTFRDAHGKSNSKSASSNKQGMLLRDNVYGDLPSDAKRRDFTANALYYNPSNEVLTEYLGGVSDIESRTLRMIGDPESRYKEDPVRMLRAVRFQAKLGFSIDDATKEPIRRLSHLLVEIPPARLFEESLKLFLSGKAETTLRALHEYQLLAQLCPSAARAMSGNSSIHKALVLQATQNTDLRIAENKRVTPAFIFAAFLWPALQEEMRLMDGNTGRNTYERMQSAADAVIFEQQRKTAIPKRFQIPMREIWTLQLRLIKRDNKRALGLLEHPRFRAAYDFVLLREQAGEELNGLGQWWTDFQFADADTRHAMIEKRSAQRKRRPRRRKNGDRPQ